MYKVYFDTRFLLLSSQPDRLQKYSLFHKYSGQKAFSTQIMHFLAKPSKASVNIHSPNIEHLWAAFIKEFQFVEAAGGIVLDENNSLLLIKRHDHWDAPKGHFEPNESSEQCARREINEECGIETGENISELNPTYHIYNNDGAYYLKKTNWFLFRHKGSRITTPQLNEGISLAEWIEREQLPEISISAWPSVNDVIDEVVSKHIIV